MSGITGNGYGDKHDWVNKGTEQSSIPQHRSTLYECKKCNYLFRHWYHLIPDIFEAMEHNKIKQDCSSENENNA